MSDFAYVITAKDYPKKGEVTSLVLDTVNDTQVDCNSTITTHPISSGDYVADHMYDDPDSVSINGTFSLNGNKGIVIDAAGGRLDNVEKIFEDIKRLGVLCDAVKVHIVQNGTTSQQEARFKVRENLVLRNIVWTEGINSLKYSFNFTQVLLVEAQSFEVDEDDRFLPNVTEPQTLNFTDTLIDWNQLDATIVKVLADSELLTANFLNMLQSMGHAAIATMVGAALGAIIVAAMTYYAVTTGILSAVLTTSAAISATGVGAIVGAAIVVTTAIVVGIVKLVKDYKYRIKPFKKYLSDKKNNKEVRRFGDLIGTLHDNLSILNNAIKVYAVSSNEPQECMLSLDDNYFIFTFTKNNTNGRYGLAVENFDLMQTAVKPDITGSPTNIGQLRSDNCLFRTSSSGLYVYLVYAGEDSEEEKNKLTNYYIMTSSIKMEDYNQAVTDIIKNAITR